METKSPLDTLLLLSNGYIVSRCLHVVSDLGIADALDTEPKTPEILASETGTNVEALTRVLRLLSAYGVFEYRDNKFSHSEASQMLRSDHPKSIRAFIRMVGLPMFWHVYEHMEYSIRTGLVASTKVVPEGLWKSLDDHPESRQILNEAMVSRARTQIEGILKNYDFSSFSSIGDIGGGRGHLLQEILNTTPDLHGVLFDLPQAFQDADIKVSKRFEIQEGDFFKDNLPVCDAYILKEVIHDWGDKESIAILKAVHRVAPSHAKLLIIEGIVPDDPYPHFFKTLDVGMMVLFGGQQRSRIEYEALFDSAGFRFQRQIDIPGNISILEAIIA